MPKNRAELRFSASIPVIRDIHYSILLELKLFLSNFVTEEVTLETLTATELPFPIETGEAVIAFYNKVSQSNVFSPLVAKEILEIIRKWSLRNGSSIFKPANDS